MTAHSCTKNEPPWCLKAITTRVGLYLTCDSGVFFLGGGGRGKEAKGREGMIAG